MTAAARAFIARAGFDPAYGARPLKRTIQQEIENPLATEILEGAFPESSTVKVDEEGGEIVFVRTTTTPSGEPNAQ